MLGLLQFPSACIKPELFGDKQSHLLVYDTHVQKSQGLWDPEQALCPLSELCFHPPNHTARGLSAALSSVQWLCEL